MIIINPDKYKGHTKGPLSIGQAHTEIRIRDKRYYQIATFLFRYDGNDASYDVTEAEANARLFADSPLILQRCIELEEEVKYWKSRAQIAEKERLCV